MRKHTLNRHAKLDFEVNIVPIIDCFTILITFMLAAGVYVSIGILDVGISQEGGQIYSPEKSAVNITIELNPGRKLVLKVTGKEKQVLELGMKDGAWATDELQVRLSGLKQRWPDVNSLVVDGSPEVTYQDVIKVMAAAKKTHPEVLLGGF